MKPILLQKFAPLLIAVLVFSGFIAAQQEPGDFKISLKYDDLENARQLTTRGEEPTDKLSPELRILVKQFETTRGPQADQIRFSDNQLETLFGIAPDQDNPFIGVEIQIASETDARMIERLGAQIYLSSEGLVLARVPINLVERIASERNVRSIEVQKSSSIPPVPQEKSVPAINLEAGIRGGERGAGNTVEIAFDSKGLTGKGVIIGVVDTGIDWKHPDFIRADGTSRILALWDMMDESWTSSSGKIGSSPPTPSNRPTFGTVYSNEQINAALRGKGTVNSMDYQGHGTASAGTAAGNGRANTKGDNKGVAPEADLVIVKASDCGSFTSDHPYILGTFWIAQFARKLQRPVVINHSLGGHFSAHNGTELDERLMDQLAGPGKAGIGITVAAGNEGTHNLRAGGRFGPHRPGQADTDGPIVLVTVNAEILGKGADSTKMLAYFDHRDEWGLYVQALKGSALLAEDSRPLGFFLAKVDNRLKFGVPEGMKPSASAWGMLEDIARGAKLEEKLDRVIIPLPAGRYLIQGFGASEKVVNGNFDLYLPFYSEADFGQGTIKRGMVGSPGTAANVITVGSYDFRSQWLNHAGQNVLYNLPLGDISDYSNPGGALAGGAFKPEITAPARFTISSLSGAARPGSSSCSGGSMGAQPGGRNVIGDGLYVAWSGTSAAAPFTAGVIGLMLQKNPNLDSEQIKEILTRTAIKDDNHVGAVPNPEWGFGKINPAAAIAATPTSATAPGRRNPE